MSSPSRLREFFLPLAQTQTDSSHRLCFTTTYKSRTSYVAAHSSLAAAGPNLFLETAGAFLPAKQCCLHKQKLSLPARHASLESCSCGSERSLYCPTRYTRAGCIDGRRRPTLAEILVLSSQLPLSAVASMQHCSAHKDWSAE